MNHKICRGLFLIIIALSICAPTAPAKTLDQKPIFVFHTDEFWLNLHHFLYVLGRAQNKETDTAREAVSGAPADQESGFRKLNANEQKIWREAVAAYAAGPSKKDIVFDSPMPDITNALARQRDSKTLTISDHPGVVTVLQRAGPIYRKAWWKKHHEANRRWQKAMDALLKLSR